MKWASFIFQTFLIHGYIENNIYLTTFRDVSMGLKKQCSVIVS